MLGTLRCFFRNRHEPVRHPLGGFRCTVCGTAGTDLEQMGFKEGGYVSPVRRLYVREREQVGCTSTWDSFQVMPASISVSAFLRKASR